MKVAFLASGPSVHTVRWVRYFADGGYDFHLTTSFTSKPLKGVKINEFKYFGKFAYPLRMWKMRSAAKNLPGRSCKYVPYRIMGFARA